MPTFDTDPDALTDAFAASVWAQHVSTIVPQTARRLEVINVDTGVIVAPAKPPWSPPSMPVEGGPTVFGQLIATTRAVLRSSIVARSSSMSIDEIIASISTALGVPAPPPHVRYEVRDADTHMVVVAAPPPAKPSALPLVQRLEVLRSILTEHAT